MIENKRFTLTDNGLNVDVCLVDNITGKEYESNFDDIVDLLNELHEENKKLKQVNEMLQMDFAITERNLMEENEELKSENDSYRNMFFEIVETALTDKNCRELYCKGILDIFDKANSLNQAREMIKEHLK